MRYFKIPHLALDFEEIKPDDEIYLQEKVDGSQFRVYFEEDGIHFGSKGVNDTDDKMFKLAIENATKIFEGKEEYKWHTFFFEYLAKPKQNTLCYDRVPKDNLVLFDVHTGKEWLEPSSVEKIASELRIESIPLLGCTTWKNLSMEIIQEQLKLTSYLEGQQVEGVVVKCYSHLLHNKHSNMYEPIFFKYVREDFKEQNRKEWNDKKKGHIAEIIEEYRNVNRYQKAVQHLKERGELTNSVKDIGLLMKEVCQDVEAEEQEEIKKKLYAAQRKEILKGISSPVPAWYKEKLTLGEKS